VPLPSSIGTRGDPVSEQQLCRDDDNRTCHLFTLPWDGRGTSSSYSSFSLFLFLLFAVRTCDHKLTHHSVDEDEILNRVGELRTKLTAQMAAGTGPRLRATDSHGIAMAKQEEMERLRNAFGVSGQYKEGSAFIRETDEEKAQRYAEREERDRIKAQEIVARELEAEKREKERVEREKLRRREEYYKKQQGSSKPLASSSSTLPPKPPRSDRRRHDDSPRGRSRSRSPLPYSKEILPPPRRRRSPVDSRSRSPSPKRRARSPTDSRSPSPVRRKADSRSRSPVRRRRSPSDSRSRSRSPVRTRRRSSTPPPPRRR
jgi:serine/arginine repetitive matrix protein 2